MFGEYIILTLCQQVVILHVDTVSEYIAETMIMNKKLVVYFSASGFGKIANVLAKSAPGAEIKPGKMM